jgi:argininosuccinate lyase
MAKKTTKPWGGRFRQSTDENVEAFTASIQYDCRLYSYDIEGSMAHARMLCKQGMLTRKELTAIINGLTAIRRDIERGVFAFHAGDEDIHMAIEKALIARIGDTGGKLHTARSRNDQVTLDLRLFLRDEIGLMQWQLAALKTALLTLAKKEIKTVAPGYTHLQRAQPVLLAHYLLAFWEMIDRDEQRLSDCLGRVKVMPLGAAALAGTSLPIDREYVAELLDFPAVTKNSMDTVADRDFVAEFIFVCSLIMMHLSRFCEDLIVWSTEEFGFVEISDAFTTGSSIMPQKKNPDVAELIRGKTGRVYGSLTTILTLLKGLPMTYNRDLQEDKEPLFDTVDTVRNCLEVLTGMLGNLTFNRARLAEAAAAGYSTATDIAEYLVLKGVPFRESHGIVGRIVAYADGKGKKVLSDLSLTEFRRFYPGFEKDIYDRLTVGACIDRRKSTGGTAEEAVKRRIREIDGRS